MSVLQTERPPVDNMTDHELDLTSSLLDKITFHGGSERYVLHSEAVELISAVTSDATLQKRYGHLLLRSLDLRGVRMNENDIFVRADASTSVYASTEAYEEAAIREASAITHEMVRSSNGA